jgi:hypothetical protein
MSWVCVAYPKYWNIHVHMQLPLSVGYNQKENKSLKGENYGNIIRHKDDYQV